LGATGRAQQKSDVAATLGEATTEVATNRPGP